MSFHTRNLRYRKINAKLCQLLTAFDINVNSQEPDFSDYIAHSESKPDSNYFVFYTVFWGKQVYSDRQKNINRKITDIYVSTWYQETKRTQTLY